MFKHWLICAIVSLSLLVTGCASDFTGSQGPTIKNINVPSAVPTDTYHVLSATTNSTETEIEFDSDGGDKEADYGSEIKWKAPDEEGEVEIKIIASEGGNITTSLETVQVKEPEVKITETKVTQGEMNNLIQIHLKNTTQYNIKTLDIALYAWGGNGPLVSNGTDKYKAIPAPIDGENIKEDSYSFQLNKHFETAPVEVTAYVTRVEYTDEDKEPWSLEE